MPYNSSTIMLLPSWFTAIIPADMFHHPDQFIAGGLTPSTIATYSAGKKKYIQFCTTYQATPLSSSETTLGIEAPVVILFLPGMKGCQIRGMHLSWLLPNKFVRPAETGQYWIA